MKTEKRRYGYVALALVMFLLSHQIPGLTATGADTEDCMKNSPKAIALGIMCAMAPPLMPDDFCYTLMRVLESDTSGVACVKNGEVVMKKLPESAVHPPCGGCPSGQHCANDQCVADTPACKPTGASCSPPGGVDPGCCNHSCTPTGTCW